MKRFWVKPAQLTEADRIRSMISDIEAEDRLNSYSAQYKWEKRCQHIAAMKKNTDTPTSSAH